MAVRLKMVCTSTAAHAGGTEQAPLHEAAFKVVYEPVSPGTPVEQMTENQVFFAATPSGTMQFAAVRKQPFEAGKSYYVTITPEVAP